MANILGGSPLGLIGLKSTPQNQMSTFNGGDSRNVNVGSYNTQLGSRHPGSLFTGRRSIRAWPDLKSSTSTDGTKTWDITGTNDVQNGKSDTSSRKTLHTDSVYDTSILNIIEKLSGTKASLRPADFAYLKNVGVYPNNRLMIARRFASPSPDNIMVPNKNELGSFATLISWVPEGTDFLEISFGEVWEEAEADFKGLLTSLGEDVSIGNAGGISGAAGNLIPLPGFTEILQRNVLASLGLIETEGANMMPAGNPNLIKNAKRRKTIGYSEAGSGLKCKVNIKMTCEYEMKFISGIDPTIVWMDLLGMINRFGTSNSDMYGLNKEASAKMIRWANNPNTLVSEFVGVLQSAIESVKAEVNKAISLIKDEPESTTPPKEESAANLAKKAGFASVKFLNTIASKISVSLIQKYRVKLIGIINALSGLPSTPWHITVGNPMRPTFCSGDMLVDEVNLKLGPILAFNDLPSTITVDFTLTNARPWGLQEIMAKFNSGYLRSVDVQKSFYETSNYTGKDKDGKEATFIEPPGLLPFDNRTESTGSTTSNTGASGVNTTGTQSTGTQSTYYTGTSNPTK